MEGDGLREVSPGVYAGFTYRGTRGDPRLREQREREIAEHERQLEATEHHRARWTKFEQVGNGGIWESKRIEPSHPSRKIVIMEEGDGFVIYARKPERQHLKGIYGSFRAAERFARKHRNESNFFEG